MKKMPMLTKLIKKLSDLSNNLFIRYLLVNFGINIKSEPGMLR